MSKTYRYNPDTNQKEKERRYVVRSIKGNKDTDLRDAFPDELREAEQETGLSSGDSMGC